MVTSGEGWTVPRTPDGPADIQGVWVNFDRTPLEVPRSEDAARLAAIETWYPGLEVTADGIRGIEGPLPGGLSRLLGEGTGEGNSSKRSPPRRSMVVDPPTGRVPVRAEAEATKNESLTRLTDTWENHTPLGKVHHAWRARRHVSCRVQQRLSHPAESGLRRDFVRNDP